MLLNVCAKVSHVRLKVSKKKFTALTTTIPAQLVKKFKIPIVPIVIERINNINFKIVIKNPITFDNEETTKTITDKLNLVLEKMISYKPELWIWSHNRWK